jgi:uncharacterized membrane protein YcaP (DUF421 family)
VSELNRLGTWLEMVFGADTPVEPLSWGQTAARAIVVYVIGIALIRMGKSRMLSRLSAADVLTGLILGSLLSRGITGNASISGTTSSCTALVAIHWLFTRIACHSSWFGDLVKGHGNLIVKDGKIIEDALWSHHLSRHDLEEQLRIHGVGSVDEVECAHKERSGEVSVVKRKAAPRVVEIAVESGVQMVRIELQ